MEKGKNILTKTLDENEKFGQKDLKDKKTEEQVEEDKEIVFKTNLEEDSEVKKSFNTRYILMIAMVIVLLVIYLILTNIGNLFKGANIPDETVSYFSDEITDTFSGYEIDLVDAKSLKDDIVDFSLIGVNDEVYWLIKDGALYYNSNPKPEIYDLYKSKIFVSHLHTDFGDYLLDNEGGLYLVKDKIITKVITFNINDVLKFGSLNEGKHIYVITSENKLATAYYKDLTNWKFITLSKSTLKNIKVIDYACNSLFCSDKVGMIVNDNTVLFMDKTNNDFNVLEEASLPNGASLKDSYHQYLWLKDGRLLYTDYKYHEVLEVQLYEENIFEMNDNGYFETESGYVLNTRYDYTLYNDSINYAKKFTDAKITNFGEGYLVADDILYIGQSEFMRVLEKAEFTGSIEEIITPFNDSAIYLVSDKQVYKQINGELQFEEIDVELPGTLRSAKVVSKSYPNDEKEVVYFNTNSGVNEIVDSNVVVDYISDDYDYVIDVTGKAHLSSNEAFITDLNMLGNKILPPDEEAIVSVYSFKAGSVYAVGGSYLERNLVDTMPEHYYVVTTESKIYLYNEDFKMVQVLLENYKKVIYLKGAVYVLDSEDLIYSIGYNYNGQLFRVTEDANDDEIMDFSNELERITN